MTIKEEPTREGFWLSEEGEWVPDGWDEHTVGELVSANILAKPLDGNHGNIHPKGGDFVQSGVPFIMASDLNEGKVDQDGCSFITRDQADNLMKGFAVDGDILLSHKATIGRIARLKTNYDYVMLTPQVTYYRVIDTVILDSNFLYYFFLSPFFQSTLSMLSNSGSTRAYIGITAQRDLPIRHPKIDEQKAIAKILSSLDDKIELLREQNETLEDLAQTIFKHWFIDFNFPDENGKPYKDSGGEMVPSELGGIPKGWEVKGLSKIADFLNGIAVKKYIAERDEESVPVLKIRELKSGSLQSADRANRKAPEKYYIKEGTIIFSWSGSLELTVWTGEEVLLNQHLFKVTSDHFPDWFCFHWIGIHLNRFRAIAADKATTMGHIQRSHLDEALCTFPTNISHCPVGELYLKTTQNELQIRELTSLRDILLPKLMKGEIRVNAPA